MTPARDRVWVTRAEPGASATADRLRQIGLEPLIAPLLVVQPVVSELNLRGVSALAFTSANGVRAFAALTNDRALPVFTVGEATAEAARQAGFREVRSGDGDVAALASLVAGEHRSGEVLCPGGEARAGDLVGDLARASIQARALTLYRTVPASGPDEAQLADASAVLIHSPRAASVLNSLGFDLRGLVVVGLSAACLKPLARLHVKRWGVAERPTEAALMDALCVALGIFAGRR